MRGGMGKRIGRGMGQSGRGRSRRGGRRWEGTGSRPRGRRDVGIPRDGAGGGEMRRDTRTRNGG